MKYDYLIVGAGLYGAVLSYKLRKQGKTVLVIDKRDHIGGNCYTEFKDGIHIHKYGPHIFHTNDKEIWDFVNEFCEFEQFIYSPIAVGADLNIYNLPFNMNTFKQVYNLNEVDKVKKYLKRYKNKLIRILNFEDYGISQLGYKMYYLLVKEYTEKQWNMECYKLPINILKRIPVRFSYDNNYFDDLYQGIPKEGYTRFIEKLFGDTLIKLNCPYQPHMYDWANRIVYCGSVDELCDYELGILPWRSLRFEEKEYKDPYGSVVTNYCTKSKPFTRVINHKLFLRSTKDHPDNICTFEYPSDITNERYYPINTTENNILYSDYVDLLTNKYPKIILCGRLGEYEYLNMDQVIKKALNLWIA
jgi:UDP-galactopyranose mutase